MLKPKGSKGYLVKDKGWWVVRFTPLHPEYRNIMELFGGDTLPTPFATSARPSQVLAAIEFKDIGIVA